MPAFNQYLLCIDIYHPLMSA